MFGSSHLANFTPPPSLKLFERKHLSYQDRKKFLEYLWTDVEWEYNEANNATNIYNIFTEILENIPTKVLSDNETISLFKNALENTIGIENSKTKHKKYI